MVMLETLNSLSPFLATMGGSGVSVVLLRFLYQISKDMLSEYRLELREANARRREIEELHRAEEVRHRRCVEEREMMRVAMRAHGVPFNPEDWIEET